MLSFAQNSFQSEVGGDYATFSKRTATKKRKINNTKPLFFFLSSPDVKLGDLSEFFTSLSAHDVLFAPQRNWGETKQI